MFSTVISALNEGFIVTFELFLITLVGALPLGLLISFGSMNKWTIRFRVRTGGNVSVKSIRPIQMVFRFIVWLFRGSPLLLQLMIIFYIPGELGYQIWSFPNARFWAAAVAFILNYACYFSEIYRGGIEAIPRGQDEAGMVLGMTKTQIFFKVKLAQLIRRIVPPMSNEIITLVKDTSLANTIALAEVIWAGRRFMKSDGLVWPLFFTGVYYLAFSGILTLFFGWVEKKLSFYKV